MVGLCRSSIIAAIESRGLHNSDELIQRLVYLEQFYMQHVEEINHLRQHVQMCPHCQANQKPA